MTYTPTETPRIYVACLAAYNNGILHGEWIDCDQDADSIQEEINAMLKQSPEPNAEEWAIHDSDCFKGLKISESESIEKVAELAALIGEHGAAFAAYVDHVGMEYATADGFQESYRGKYESEKDFAEELWNETREIPDFLRSHIDWESVANDLFVDDYFGSRRDSKTYVFNRN
ncbi:MAG: antirestriction protein ArdA [Phormidesmis sp. CAN_BIN44]|nr:antirestriction protein ArdA [Phormidesmis sp. CAN_BIN44]